MAASNSSQLRLSSALSPSSISKLMLDRRRFRATHLSTTNKQYDKIIIGAVIVHPSTHKLLLLKRAAHEIYYPNVFELPSGNVDPNDLSLGDALFREVFEETGLTVTSVLSELLESFEYETTKVNHGVSVTKTCVQVNFIVEVESVADVIVNPDEHSIALWVGEDDLEALEMTNGMRELVKKAFRSLYDGCAFL